MLFRSGYHYTALGLGNGPIDTDGDGFADYLEDANGNGLTEPSETSFTDYYNGVLPSLTIVGGNYQSGATNRLLPLPLIVEVTDTNGVPLTNAPVAFTVSQGTLSLRTDTNG